MLQNYLKITLRNLLRHKAFAFINIIGLAVGMVCCLLIFLYVDDELGYDRYHANADRMYRLAADVEGASYENGVAKVSDQWGPGAKAELPEIVEETRFVPFGQALVVLPYYWDGSVNGRRCFLTGRSSQSSSIRISSDSTARNSGSARSLPCLRSWRS
jgi:hypothetical protein